MAVSVIPDQKIVPAAAGNQALQDLLKSLTDTVNQQQAVTGTSGRNTPPQAKANVTYQAGTYIVEIQNAGTASNVSVLQSAQNAARTTAVDTVQPVTAVFHQVRCATSPRFSASDNVQVFGGDTGSAQTIWSLPGTTAGQYYFQVRSSYDGVNFNLWRNANGGGSVSSTAGGVTQAPADNCLWATFQLPGGQVVGFGAGQADDGDTFTTPGGLLTGAMCAIPGQNGFHHQEDHVSHGVDSNAIVLEVPLGATATTTSGYPARIQQTYEDGEHDIWSGSASIFAYAANPFGINQKIYAVTGGMWIVHTLPGGAQFAVGSGIVNDGSAIPVPAELPWISAGNLVGIPSPNHAYSQPHQARGYNLCSLDGLTVHATFRDNAGASGNVWGGTANWFAVACSDGYPLQTIGEGKFFVLQIADGTRVCIGAGNGASGAAVTLPDGFDGTQILPFATPRDTTGDGNPESGIRTCAFNGLVPVLTYEDSEGNQWTGNLNWLIFAWV